MSFLACSTGKRNAAIQKILQCVCAINEASSAINFIQPTPVWEYYFTWETAVDSS